jgi:hypothetical protein
MNITGYLKDLDGEEQRLRQEIMMRQVRIQQIQDMRVLMMHREEERAASAGEASPFGSFPNGGTIAFRDPATYRHHRAETQADQAARIAYTPGWGEVGPSPVQMRKERSDKGVPNPNRGRKGRRPLADAARPSMSERIRKLMADGKPRMSSEIMHALEPHRVMRKDEKAVVYSALHSMKAVTNELHQSQMGEPYTLVQHAS